MKRYFITYLTFFMMLPVFVSCSDDDERTDSRLTYYVKFEMLGKEFVELPIGTDYVDAGCKATLNGTDYTNKITVTGINEVDKNVPGLYEVTYTGTNEDGFSSSVTRTVAVCDPSITADISGSYVTVDGTKRIRNGVETAFPKFAVNIEKKAPGLFYVDDMLGGYYSQRAGYGDAFSLKGYIQLHANDSISACSGHLDGWGDSYETFTEGFWNKETGAVNWNVLYANMQFIVVLNKSKE